MSRESTQHDEPLGLTVHSLPSPESVGADPQSRTRVGRWKMMVVLLICAAPVIASYFTYYVIRPEARRVFGTLIDPQRPLPEWQGVNLQGEPVNMRTLKGQWLLVSVAGGACNDACQKHLYLQRQLREGLGKEKDRLDWVWLIPDDAAVPAAIQPALKGATLLRVPADKLSQWLEPQAGQALESHLYLVDPLGNWMMRFPQSMDAPMAPKVKRDIERVLRATGSWDTAGR